jgi:hypothetical protein
MYKKQNNKTLTIYQNPKGTKPMKGPNHPPKKKSVMIKAKISILPYSPKKNSAKVMLEYSTLNPATNSASASEKAMNSGASAKINQPASCWKNTISVKLKELTIKIIGKIIKLSEISYEIICEALRSDPMKAYFELELQPLKIIP